MQKKNLAQVIRKKSQINLKNLPLIQNISVGNHTDSFLVRIVPADTSKLFNNVFHMISQLVWILVRNYLLTHIVKFLQLSFNLNRIKFL